MTTQLQKAILIYSSILFASLHYYRAGLVIISKKHRCTRREGGERGGSPPGLEKFEGKLCFQGKRKLLKNLE